MSKSKLKKIGMIFVAMAAVVLLILASIPFFIDVDEKLRPIITQTIENALDVKADLGRLSLSLLWGIRVGVEDFKLTENKTKNILFEVKNANLQIPFLSLLTGTLSVTLDTQEPTIRIVRFKDGSLNVSQLMKSSEGKTAQSNEASSGAGAAAVGSRLSFSTNVRKAQLQVVDHVTGFNFNIDQLNLRLKDVGINKPFESWIQTQINVDNKKGVRVVGSMEYEGKTKIQMGSSGFESVFLDSSLDLSGLEIAYEKLVNKSKDVSLKLKTEISASQNSAKINTLRIIAGSFDVLVQGAVENYANPTVDLSVQSNELDLSQWKAVLLPFKEMDIEGKLGLNLKAAGTFPKILFNGSVMFKNGALKLAAIQPRITDIQMAAEMNGETLRFKNTSVKIGKSDLKLEGSVSNFSAPVVDVTLISRLLDLDEMFPKAAASKKEDPKGAVAQDVGAVAAAPLAAVQANPTIKSLDLKAKTRIEKLVLSSAEIEDVRADTYFKGLILTIKNASLKAFGGTAKAFVQLDMSAPLPSYQVSSEILDIDINRAVVSQFKELDKAITGKANGNIILSGAGLRSDQVKNNIKGSGKFNIKEGAWSGAVPLKKLGEKLSKIPKVGEKLSGLKVDDRFRIFSADFSVQKGELQIQKAVIDTMEANTAIEASGVVDFDQNLRMKGSVLAPIKDVPKDLKAADGRGKIPFELYGKATAPEVEWEKTLQVIAKSYAKDEGKKILNKGLEKAKEELGDKMKGLFKGIKF